MQRALGKICHLKVPFDINGAWKDGRGARGHQPRSRHDTRESCIGGATVRSGHGTLFMMLILVHMAQSAFEPRAIIPRLNAKRKTAPHKSALGGSTRLGP
jgi:hypothetical protein